MEQVLEAAASRAGRGGGSGGGSGGGKPPVRPGGFGVPPQDDPNEPGYWTETDRLRALRPLPTTILPSKLTLTKPIEVSDRHFAKTPGRTKDINTTAEHWVPVREELQAIENGHGTLLPGKPMVGGKAFPGDLYEIRGRVYVVEKNGHAYPYRGPGLHPLGPEEYSAYKAIHNSKGHPVGMARAEAQWKSLLSPDQWDYVLRIAEEEWKNP